MIFDLIESSDSIQSESSRREEKSDSSPLEINCTCPSQIECNCPEVPECICEQHHDEPLRFVPTVSRSVQHHPIDLPPTQKLNEYAQTESFNISFVQNNEKGIWRVFY